MRVLVTGATGFVGSHIAVALQKGGHDVRLLARRPEQVPVTFAPHETTFEDIMPGDVLDAGAVRAAVEGCDAVVHAAAIFSLDPRRAGEMLRTNEQATRTVLGAAAEAGATRIVHLSSTVALTGRGPIPPDLPLGDVDLPYAKSKVASEAVARQFQADGAPVACVYPGSVYGPHDPYVGENIERLRWIVRGLFPLWSTGSLPSVDVRDTAAVVRALVDGAGSAPLRYLVPLHNTDGDEVFSTVSRVIGRRRPHIDMPGVVAIGGGRLTDAMQRHLPSGWARYPADHEASALAARGALFDSSPTTKDLGVAARPFEDSIRDTVAWLVDAGHLPTKYRPRVS